MNFQTAITPTPPSTSNNPDPTISKLTLAHKFQLLGQRWRFLKPCATYMPPLLNRNKKQVEEINKIEEKTTNERILELYEDEIHKILGMNEEDIKQIKAKDFQFCGAFRKRTTNYNKTRHRTKSYEIKDSNWEGRNAISESDDDEEDEDNNAFEDFTDNNKENHTSIKNDNTNSFGNKANVKKSVKPILPYDAEELAISLENIRMFYHKKEFGILLDDAINLTNRVIDSPRMTGELYSHDGNLILEPEIANLIPQAPKSEKPSTCRKSTIVKPPVPIFKLTKELEGKASEFRTLLIATKQPKALLNLGKNRRLTMTNAVKKTNIPKKKKHMPTGEKLMQRLSIAHEQLKVLKSAKSFKKYAEEKNFRIPICLKNVES